MIERDALVIGEDLAKLQNNKYPQHEDMQRKQAKGSGDEKVPEIERHP